MRVVVIHPSGARYEGPQRYAEQWWGRFEGPATTAIAPEPVADEEAPKVVGVDGGASGPVHRSFESEAAYSYDVPIISAGVKFGFVRNEENR